MPTKYLQSYYVSSNVDMLVLPWEQQFIKIWSHMFVIALFAACLLSTVLRLRTKSTLVFLGLELGPAFVATTNKLLESP